VDALEPTVLAELSEDHGLMSVYGSDTPNDIYLFIGSKIPQFAHKICKYYDPVNPTVAGIALAKRHCKKERTICKVLHLSSGYGAGAVKIHETLVMSGVDITLKEVSEIRTMYWEIFAGVKQFQEQLTDEWKDNMGWFRDGLGCRIAVDDGYEKDILNRCIQNTGHKILVKYLRIMQTLRAERGLWDSLHPLVCDFHDETVWECKTEKEAECIKLMNDVWKILNNELGGTIALAGKPEVVESFSSFKCE